MMVVLAVLILAALVVTVALALGQRRVDAAYRLGRVHGATFGARK